MAKKKTNKSRTSSPSRAGELFRFAWDAASAALGAALTNAGRLVTVAFVLAIAITWLAGYAPLRKHVSRQQADPIRIVFDWPAGRIESSALAPEVRVDLEQRVLGAVTLDPFDQASLHRACVALEASGWFRDSPRVVRTPGGIVRVSGTWRVPAAVVIHGTTAYLVDDEGAPLCLPVGGKPGERLFRIRNPWSGPPERNGAVAYGHPWTGGDVQMALELLGEVAAHPAVADQIAGIDLANCIRSGGNELRIETVSGATLVWGAPPSAPVMGEVTTARKLDHLQFVLSGTVRLDRPGAPINLHLPVIEIDESATATASAATRG